MSLLKHVITKEKQVEKNIIQLKFEADNKEKYKVKEIQDSAVYGKKSENYLPRVYYLILWKVYYKEKNI